MALQFQISEWTLVFTNLLKELSPALPNTGIQDCTQCPHCPMPYSRGPQLSGIWCLMIWGGDDIIIEIKCMISVMHSNHPETILPPLDCEKIVFRETHPCCQRGWGMLYHSLLPPKLCLISHASNKVPFSLLVLKGNKDNTNPHSLKSLHIYQAFPKAYSRL